MYVYIYRDIYIRTHTHTQSHYAFLNGSIVADCPQKNPNPRQMPKPGRAGASPRLHCDLKAHTQAVVASFGTALSAPKLQRGGF